MGTLYVVGTPIGNLADICGRALTVLENCAVIAAEDTRHSRKLLQAHGINPGKLVAYHQHNEKPRTSELLHRLAVEDVALITDAGTPGVSDPGVVLVREARRQGFPVIPIPGASAVTAAVSVSGLVSGEFRFLGFAANRREARRRQLASLREESAPTVLFETPHRILACLEDLANLLEPSRQMVLCRELTKLHEQTVAGTVTEVLHHLVTDDDSRRGEFVLVIAGAQALPESGGGVDKLLATLLSELPVKQAVRLAAQISGAPRNKLYDVALTLMRQRDSESEA